MNIGPRRLLALGDLSGQRIAAAFKGETMPMPKGARKDPNNPGKFILPEGHIQKPTRERRREPEPTAHSARVEERFSEERKNSRNFVFRIQVVHPSGKYWIADTQDYSPQMLATNYGGGKFEVWKMDTSTGQALGDPLPYNVDTNVHPQRLFDPAMSPQGGMQGRFGGQGPIPAWQGGNGGYGAPGAFGGPSAWPAVAPQNNAAVADLEDDLEDLEKDLEKANLLCAQYLRERDEARVQLAETKAAADKKEMMALFSTQLAEAKGGTKDPMETMLQMIRLQAEMNGGVIGKGGAGASDPITGAVSLMNVILQAAKSVPQADTGGSALGGLMQVASQYLPLFQKIVEGKDKGFGAPPGVLDEKPQPKPQPAPAAQPEPVADSDLTEAFQESVKAIPDHIASEAYAEWILKQSTPGWLKLHKIIMTDKPENFLAEAVKMNPELGNTDVKKQWIVQAIASTQAKLLAANAK